MVTVPINPRDRKTTVSLPASTWTTVAASATSPIFPGVTIANVRRAVSAADTSPQLGFAGRSVADQGPDRASNLRDALGPGLPLKVGLAGRVGSQLRNNAQGIEHRPTVGKIPT
jgi:hypothetical protein